VGVVLALGAAGLVVPEPAVGEADEGLVGAGAEVTNGGVAAQPEYG
jgi:hypothetical protein